MDDDKEYNSKSIEHKTKDQLYKFYYDIMKEIQGHTITVDQGIYQECLESTSMLQVINYIKQAIDILIVKKTEKRNEQLTQLSLKNINNNTNEYLVIINENQLRKMEGDIRRYIKNHFQTKLQIEALEKKISSYLDMEDEYNEMKEKLKYENGMFLNNDRKDNEILILRAENSNLKASIANLEFGYKKKEDRSKKDKAKMDSMDKQIEKLKSTIAKLEKTNTNYNSNSNSCNNINIQINQNGSTSSKWVTRHEDENYTSLGKHYYDSDKVNTSEQRETMNKINNIKQFKQSKAKTKHKLTKETIGTHYSSNSAKRISLNNNSSPNKIIHNKNNSMNMKLTDAKIEELGLLKNINNYSNLNVGFHLQAKKNMKKFTQITHLIPTSKIPISQRSKIKQQQITKLYFTSKNSNRIGNHSAFGIRTYEKV